MLVKRCTRCKKVKSLDLFYKGHAKYKKTVWCKNCVADYKKIYQLKNKAKIQAFGKQYRKRSKKKITRRQRSWGIKNVKFWKEHDPYDNKDLKKCTKCKELQERINFCKHNSRKDGLRSYCKKCLSGVSLFKRHGITLKEKEEIYESQKMRCFICQKKFGIDDLHIDHQHQHKGETLDQRSRLSEYKRRKTVRALLCLSCNTHLLSWIEAMNFNKISAINALRRAYKCIRELPAQKFLPRLVYNG